MGNVPSTGYHELTGPYPELAGPYGELRGLLRSGGHTKLRKMLDYKRVDLAALARTRHFRIGKSPLHLAVDTGSVDIVRRILALGFDVNATEVSWLSNYPIEVERSVHYMPALHMAVYRGNFAVVKVFLDLGVDVSISGRINYVSVGTAELFALTKGSTDIARAISEFRATGTPISAITTSTNAAPPIPRVASVPIVGAAALTPSTTVNIHTNSDIEDRIKKAQAVDAELKELHKDTNSRKADLANASSMKRDLITALETVELRLQELTKEDERVNEREAALLNHPDYLTAGDMIRLEDKMKALLLKKSEQPGNTIKDDALDCIVCATPPSANAFTCQTCDNLVCHACLDQLALCPMCRTDFKILPARRSRFVERMLS